MSPHRGAGDGRWLRFLKKFRGPAPIFRPRSEIACPLFQKFYLKGRNGKERDGCYYFEIGRERLGVRDVRAHMVTTSLARYVGLFLFLSSVSGSHGLFFPQEIQQKVKKEVFCAQPTVFPATDQYEYIQYTRIPFDRSPHLEKAQAADPEVSVHSRLRACCYQRYKTAARKVELCTYKLQSIACTVNNIDVAQNVQLFPTRRNSDRIRHGLRKSERRVTPRRVTKSTWGCCKGYTRIHCC